MRVLIIATAITLLVVEILARPEPPVSQYLPPNQLYGPPQRPSLSNPIASPANFGINQYLPPNQQYGPPGAGSGGSGGYGEESYGPAKYDFEWMVYDQPSGNDFGQKESRDGDVTRGMYYVLLPDGRRQRVEYEADRDGYRPKISYVQEGTGIGGGYPGGTGPSAGGSGGYPGGYPSGTGGGYNY